jgi:hypothetical protein
MSVEAAGSWRLEAGDEDRSEDRPVYLRQDGMNTQMKRRFEMGGLGAIPPFN